MEHSDWLTNLEPGTEVALYHQSERYRNEFGIPLGKVAKVFTAYVLLTNGTRFRRDNGREIGYKDIHIMPVTEEIRGSAEHLWLATCFGKMDWHRFTLRQLQRIQEIITEETKS